MLRCKRALVALVVLACVAPVALAEYCKPFTRSACWPNYQAVEAWSRSLSKEATVLSPNSNDVGAYLSAAAENLNQIWTASPGFIVYPTSEADIVKTVKFAAQYNIR